MTPFVHRRRIVAQGTEYCQPFRVDRLIRNGGAMLIAGEYDALLTKITDAIRSENRRCDADSWTYDANRLRGLHSCRVAIWRMRRDARKEAA